MQLGRVGIWSRQLRYGDRSQALEAACELEELGYTALWIPGAAGGEDLLESVRDTLDATRTVCVATGILNVWGHEPGAVARFQAETEERHPGRFLLGLGVGHAPFVPQYRRPLATMAEFLDDLDGAGATGARVLAALAPRMLALARERSLGAHPYLVPAAHTAFARGALGEDALLAPAVSVVLAPSAGEALTVARADLQLYLALPNYVSAWRRLGFGDADVAGGGSDRLVRALYALGSVDDARRRVGEHLAAGADHVCVRVITSREDDATHLSREQWRELAPLTRL